MRRRSFDADNFIRRLAVGALEIARRHSRAYSTDQNVSWGTRCDKLGHSNRNDVGDRAARSKPPSARCATLAALHGVTVRCARPLQIVRQRIIWPRWANTSRVFSRGTECCLDLNQNSPRIRIHRRDCRPTWRSAASPPTAAREQTFRDRRFGPRAAASRCINLRVNRSPRRRARGACPAPPSREPWRS